MGKLPTTSKPHDNYKNKFHASNPRKIHPPAARVSGNAASGRLGKKGKKRKREQLLGGLGAFSKDAVCSKTPRIRHVSPQQDGLRIRRLLPAGSPAPRRNRRGGRGRYLSVPDVRPREGPAHRWRPPACSCCADSLDLAAARASLSVCRSLSNAIQARLVGAFFRASQHHKGLESSLASGVIPPQ